MNILDCDVVLVHAVEGRFEMLCENVCVLVF